MNGGKDYHIRHDDGLQGLAALICSPCRSRDTKDTDNASAANCLLIRVNSKVLLSEAAQNFLRKNLTKFLGKRA